MAHPTDEQAEMKRHLSAEYGQPDRTMLERTSEPYGLMWLRWNNGEGGAVEFPDRNLFVKPDGTRLSWELTR